MSPKKSKRAVASPASRRPSVKVRTKPVAKVVAKPVAKRPMPEAKEGRVMAEKNEVNQDLIAQMRDALLRRRQAMLSVVRSNRDQLAEAPRNYADIRDRASEGFEDELAAGLLAIESAQLDEIENALERIDKGEYGLCLDCGKPIPRKRLEILPFAKRCLVCEGQKERHARPAEAEEEEESEFE